MAGIIYEYEIPDSEKLFLESEQSLGLGPSGELMDFRPNPITSSDIVDQEVLELSFHVGAYGMGGSEFFGLRLEVGWLVIAIWGAGERMTAKGRNLQDSFYDNYGRQNLGLPIGYMEKKRMNFLKM